MIPNLPGEFFALLGAAAFGLNGVFVRKGQRHSPPDNGVFLTLTVNAILMSAAIAWEFLRGALPPLGAFGVLVFIGAGLFTTLLGRVAHFASTRRIGASRSSSFRVTSPIFTLALALVLLAERLELLTLAGIAAVLIGLWVVTSQTVAAAEAAHRGANPQAQGLTPPVGEAGFAPDEVRSGVILAALASASYGTGHTLRKLGLGYIPSPIFGSWLGSSVAAVGIISSFVVAGMLKRVVEANLRPLRWEFLVAGVLSSVGQLGLFYGYHLAPVAVVATLGATEPLWVMLFSQFLLRREEALTLMVALGVLLTCAGVALILVG